ncbi:MULTISPECIES: efflux transporter outer membrane subunit [Shewanella]|uniref:efflux transporter outer membrane subunit n=1 Tax=Shewanella TaxID=22 RepID=UPI0015633DB8|nr:MULTISPECIES: efflux transporter outer membrane subunit [unclassified Shewanella]MBW3517279.1 efflux transporter outer membrane subunit [Shewanella sp. NKUCC01_JLK]MCU8043622.1 efflux transporter outer membrane subunit [Shewanella sp. SM68]MCU8049704.1 efflux transporter outer membrane subunit [Shewanella sp. SM65]NRD33283.1 efflux transporter outer membrane subunit [Shewanella sp. DC2-4]
MNNKLFNRPFSPRSCAIAVCTALGSALCIALLSGCGSVMRSDFEPPALAIPEQWQHTTVNEQVKVDPWWQQFHQPELDKLVSQVLITNNDLTLATLTLLKARLQAGLTRDDLYPQLSANLDASRNQPLEGGDATKSYQAKLSVSYEVDLWGKVSANIDQAQWAALASAEDRESTTQSLVATTASLYWQIGYLNQRIDLSQKSIEYSQQTLALTQRQYDSGAVTQVNVLEAQRSMAGQEAAHSQLIQQLTVAKNALAILLNQAPAADPVQSLASGGTWVEIKQLPDVAVPDVSVGVPADLLVRRPDVKASLYQLRSALASKDATYASYFPSLSLTGGVGESTSELKELLRNPVGSLGAGLVLPFLQWNQMQINNDIADIDYQTAVVNYRKTLYSAFEDVDNAISAKQQYRYQGEKLAQQFSAAAAVEAIYESQYRNGAIGIQNWIDAQENRRSAEAALLENRYNQLTAQATLYQALGGSDIAPPLAKE